MAQVQYKFSSNKTGKLGNIKKQKQKFLDVVKDIIRISDIVLEVLDARFINETRNEEIENEIKKQGKKIIYVLNKSDLVNTKTKIKEMQKLKLCVSIKPLYDLKKYYKLIAISNSETSFIKESIKELKISKLFKKVYGAEKFSTKDNLIKKLFKKYKIQPHQAVYIGDRFSDIESARKARCLAIAIHNKCSWSDLKTIKKEKPDFIIKDFYDLKKILKKLNRWSSFFVPKWCTTKFIQ